MHKQKFDYICTSNHCKQKIDIMKTINIAYLLIVLLVALYISNYANCIMVNIVLTSVYASFAVVMIADMFPQVEEKKANTWRKR